MEKYIFPNSLLTTGKLRSPKKFYGVYMVQGFAFGGVQKFETDTRVLNRDPDPWSS